MIRARTLFAMNDEQGEDLGTFLAPEMGRPMAIREEHGEKLDLIAMTSEPVL